jgi:hypothetical protein
MTKNAFRTQVGHRRVTELLQTNVILNKMTHRTSKDFAKKPKPLRVRYFEVVELREQVKQARSEHKPNCDRQSASNE